MAVSETKTVDLTALRKPFPAEYVGKLPRVTCRACSDGRCGEHDKARCQECGNWISTRHIHLDYVGHADVTIRLLEVDPEWSWAPKSTDPDPEMLKAAVASGNPEIVKAVIDNAPPKFETDRNGNPVGLWIRLTVGGVTRLGVGSCPSNQNDAEKVLIGDALRNAAMRFGVAVDLWAKGDRADPTSENATASAGKAARRSQSAADPWESATPAQSRQNGQQAEGAWLTAAMAKVPKHATLDACAAVWRESSARVHEGKLAKADASALQNALRKRMEEIKAAPAGGNEQSLDPDDPWAVAIEGLASPEDAEKMLADLIDQRGKGNIDPERAARIERAIEAAIPGLGGTEARAA